MNPKSFRELVYLGTDIFGSYYDNDTHQSAWAIDDLESYIDVTWSDIDTTGECPTATIRESLKEQRLNYEVDNIDFLK